MATIVEAVGLELFSGLWLEKRGEVDDKVCVEIMGVDFQKTSAYTDAIKVLAKETGLKESKITQWLWNKRVMKSNHFHKCYGRLFIPKSTVTEERESWF